MDEEDKVERVVGQTKTVGFQFSITKTCTVSVDEAWDFLLSETGVSIWLGDINFDDFELNNPLKTSTGIEAKITLFKADSHLRLAWKPAYWDNNSFIEIRVLTNRGRAKLGLLHTHMMNVAQREEVKVYWTTIFEKMGTKLVKY